MQLMALNALLLFDAIFIFFLFLVSVSCLLYYLPLVPPTRSSRLLLANMSAADIESALAQGEGGGSHDETGSGEHGGVMVVEDDVTSTNLQTTVILTDPTTHILAPEHQTRSKHNKNEPPIECV